MKMFSDERTGRLGDLNDRIDCILNRYVIRPWWWRGGQGGRGIRGGRSGYWLLVCFTVDGLMEHYLLSYGILRRSTTYTTT